MIKYVETNKGIYHLKNADILCKPIFIKSARNKTNKWPGNE